MNKIGSIAQAALIAGGIALSASAQAGKSQELVENTSSKTNTVLAVSSYTNTECLIPLNIEICYVSLNRPQNYATYFQALGTLKQFAYIKIRSDKDEKKPRVIKGEENPISYEDAKATLEKERKKAGVSYDAIIIEMDKKLKASPNVCKTIEA